MILLFKCNQNYWTPYIFFMLINLRYSYIIEFLIEKFNPTTVEIPNVFFLC